MAVTLKPEPARALSNTCPALLQLITLPVVSRPAAAYTAARTCRAPLLWMLCGVLTCYLWHHYSESTCPEHLIDPHALPTAVRAAAAAAAAVIAVYALCQNISIRWCPRCYRCCNHYSTHYVAAADIYVGQSQLHGTNAADVAATIAPRQCHFVCSCRIYVMTCQGTLTHVHAISSLSSRFFGLLVLLLLLLLQPSAHPLCCSCWMPNQGT